MIDVAKMRLDSVGAAREAFGNSGVAVAVDGQTGNLELSRGQHTLKTDCWQ